MANDSQICAVPSGSNAIQSSQADLSSNCPPLELRRSERTKFLSVKAREAQATHRSKHSAGFVKNCKIYGKANPRCGYQSSSTPKQIWRAVQKNEPSEDSNPSSRTNPSAEIQQEQRAQKNKLSMETVNKGSNRNQPDDKRENLSPRQPEQSIRWQEKTGHAEDSSKPSNGDSSGQVHLDQPSPTNKNSTEAVQERETLSLPGERQPFNVKNKKFTQVKEQIKTSNEMPSEMTSPPRTKVRKPTQKNKGTAETVKQRTDQKQAVRNCESQLPAASDKVPLVKRESKISRGSCKTTSMVWQVKGRAEASRNLSRFSGEDSSNRALQDKPILNKKYSGEAVKLRDQIQPVKKSKNQLPQTSSEDVIMVKGKRFPKNRFGSSPQAQKSKWRPRRSSSRQQQNREGLHHIKWDEPITVGESCSLCNKDFAHFPVPSNKLVLELDAEFDKLPDVAVLPCCHAFHMQCLEMLLREEQLNDPPCVMCAA